MNSGTCQSDHNTPSKNFLPTSKERGQEERGKKRKRNEFWDLPRWGKFMSHNHDKEIISNLCLWNDQPPIYCGHSWAICPLTTAFNKHMESSFEPSWQSCLDKSIVSFLNDHCPNWVCVKCKPPPFGNKYHPLPAASAKLSFAWS